MILMRWSPPPPTLTRHGPSAVSKAIPRDNQADDPHHLQSRNTECSLKLSLLKTSQTRGLRRETQLQLTLRDW